MKLVPAAGPCAKPSSAAAGTLLRSSSPRDTHAAPSLPGLSWTDGHMCHMRTQPMPGKGQSSPSKQTILTFATPTCSLLLFQPRIKPGSASDPAGEEEKPVPTSPCCGQWQHHLEQLSVQDMKGWAGAWSEVVERKSTIRLVSPSCGVSQQMSLILAQDWGPMMRCGS